MSQLKAVLGPTNTGKTHYAIERMLGHSSGMIGLPLRLLAREVYDKIVAQKGVAAAALITGEERIWPKSARYFICTVEAMPVHQPVEFMAIDEIQLAEDADRGHIFTDRLLHARGTGETLLLGAETMRPILRALDLDVDSEPRERFSDLIYAGPVKVTKLPKRSAIVAFSSEQVYTIAELLRRQKGGAAVIMGALSPRTRNAQVDLYQSGEVDYLVATDAIGMGLNLDVDHIAFAASSKFDGRRQRPLHPSEMAQIAGRAGRFRSQGTFGETGECAAFDPELVRRIENHTFNPVERLEWRNSALDFKSLPALMASLSRPSGNIILRQNPNALDEWILRRMAVEPEIESLTGAARVRRLWDLCRLPDFRKAGHEGHYKLVQGLVEHLADPDARLSDAAMENRMRRLDQTLGDIPALQQRLAAIRTWTYTAYRDDWVENAPVWRDKAREIEDKLSDALHEALTARFVDRRTTALLAGLNKDYALMTDLTTEGEISVEGHVVGRLLGLTFEPDTTARTLEGKAVRNAALSVLTPILTKRLGEMTVGGDDAFTMNAGGQVEFGGHAIGEMVKGHDWLTPGIGLIGASEMSAEAKEPARARVEAWVRDHISKTLPSHSRLKSGEGQEGLEGHAKGIAFRIMESGAAIDLREDDPDLRVDAPQREILKALGVRSGRLAGHVPDAQKPAAQRLIARLRTLFDGVPCLVAPEGAGSFALDGTWPDAALLANGYLRFGARAVRADLAERLAWEISKRRREAEKSTFALPPELASIVSCPGDIFPTVVKGMGLVIAEKDPETGLPTLWRYGRRKTGEAPRARGRNSGQPEGQETHAGKGGKGRGRSQTPHPARHDRKKSHSKSGPRHEKQADPDSPFAALAALMPAETAKPKKSKPKKQKPKAPKPEKTTSDASDTPVSAPETPNDTPPAPSDTAPAAAPTPDKPATPE